jgi:hypothetical protein
MFPMKKVLIILLTILSLDSHGRFFISPGVSLTQPHQTEELNSRGEELVDFKTGLGLELDIEVIIWGPFSLNIGGTWRGGEATSQYDYSNPDNPLDTAQMENLKTNYSSITGMGGGRLRFINLKKIKSYIGAGISQGTLHLSFDENRFILNNGDKVGYQEKEDQSFSGHYMELGLEILSGEGGSLRISGRKTEMKSKAFEALGRRKISTTPVQVSIQYVHPIKW